MRYEQIKDETLTIPSFNWWMGKDEPMKETEK